MGDVLRRVDAMFVSVFFFNDTATTEIYTLSLHDALPIFSHPGIRSINNNKKLKITIRLNRFFHGKFVSSMFLIK